ncbi:hypothetical protein Tco_1199541, partial [Tanacetum coccineum]
MVSINAINQVKEQYLSFSLLSYGARTRYSGENLSILLLYILTEQAHAKSGSDQNAECALSKLLQIEPDVKDKQEVKKADDLEIKIIQDEEGKNAEDQQVYEADDDTNIDDFGCSLPHHKGADLTVEE